MDLSCHSWAVQEFGGATQSVSDSHHWVFHEAMFVETNKVAASSRFWGVCDWGRCWRTIVSKGGPWSAGLVFR